MAKVNDLIGKGLITAYGGSGTFELDFDGRNAGKTTLTAIAPTEPVDFGTDGLVAFYPLENDVLDASGNGNDGTIVGGFPIKTCKYRTSMIRTSQALNKIFIQHSKQLKLTPNSWTRRS